MHELAERIAVNFIQAYIVKDLQDFWLNTHTDNKVVLGAMMYLRAKSDGRPKFGELRVKSFIKEKNLPNILADKYLEFYHTMIAVRQDEYFERLKNSFDYFTTLESTIDRLVEIIGEMGENYQRPRITGGIFQKSFGVKSDILRDRSNTKGWGLNVSQMLDLAEKLVRERNGH